MWSSELFTKMSEILSVQKQIKVKTAFKDCVDMKAKMLTKLVMLLIRYYCEIYTPICNYQMQRNISYNVPETNYVSNVIVHIVFATYST